MTGLAFLAIAVLLAVGFAVGRIRAGALHKRGAPLHSRPAYHGFFVAIWAGIPAFVLLLLWLLLQERLIDTFLLTSLPEARLGELSPAERNLLISEVRQVAEGRIFREPSAAVQAAAERLRSWRQIADWASLVAVLAIALLGLGLAASRITFSFGCDPRKRCGQGQSSPARGWRHRFQRNEPIAATIRNASSARRRAARSG